MGPLLHLGHNTWTCNRLHAGAVGGGLLSNGLEGTWRACHPSAVATKTLQRSHRQRHWALIKCQLRAEDFLPSYQKCWFRLTFILWEVGFRNMGAEDNDSMH